MISQFRKRPYFYALLMILLLAGISASLWLINSQKTSRDLLLPEERAWLRNNPTIQLAPDPNFPPIEFFDEKGQYSGVIADIFKEIEANLNYKFEFVNLKSWDEVLNAANRREVDGITAAQMTPERSKFLFFSQPILDIPNVIIVQAATPGTLSFSTLSAKRIAVTKGNALEEYIRANYPSIVIIPVDNDLAALNEVSFKRADAAVVNLAIASYLIEKHGISNLRVAGDSGKSNGLNIATRSDQPILNQILQKGLASVSDNERKAIYNRWITLGSQNFWESSQFWLLTTSGLIIFALLILLGAIWTNVMRRQVTARTQALNLELAERKRAEEALDQERRLLRTVIDNIPDHIFARDRDCRFTLNNLSDARLMGTNDPESLLGKSDEDVFPADLAALYKADDRKVMETEQPLIDHEEPIITPDGERRWVFTTKVPLRDSEGEVIGLVGISRDITERKQAEELIQTQNQQLKAQNQEMAAQENEIRQAYAALNQLNLELEERVAKRTAALTQANAEMEAFSYSISHDLRAPLRAINGFTHIIVEENGAQLDGKGIIYLQKIVSSSARMGQMIDDLLKLFRINRRPIKFEQVDLSDLVTQIAAGLEASQPARKVSWIIPQNVLAGGDAGLIYEMIENLLSNAWKFTSKVDDALIEFGTFQQDNRSVYFVRDNGAGVDLAQAHQMFQPFTRMHSDKDFEGMGIGLSIVKRIVDHHGGQIWVKSKPGQGSVFYFTLS